MSTDHQGGNLIFICDDCETEEEDAGGYGFQDFWSSLKDEGWRCTQIGGVWNHYCPDCAHEWARRQK